MSATPISVPFGHPWVFWCGIACVTTGVVLHLPMYLESAEMGYRMAGMAMPPSMMAGMVLIVVGMGLAAVGLIPPRRSAPEATSFEVVALDDAPIRRAHVLLLMAMATAVTIDVMKPTTLAFVMPGMAAEYGLATRPGVGGTMTVASLPLAALTGMVLGSVTWGILGDRMGRRSSILLAGVVFIGTAICGAMPSFGWNLVMCFLMGVAVGGMLPIAFALLAETIPARHRGWLMVLIGGDVAGAYVLVSFLSSYLEPVYGWRILWLIGLPSGVLMIALSRWLPESPRFLLATGRATEARAVMARFGAQLVEKGEAPASAQGDGPRGGYVDLLKRPFQGLTAGICLFGLAWGLVNNGFLLWLPTNLRAAGLATESSDRLLASSALLGLPAVFLVAFLYGFWSSKRTMIIGAGTTAVALTTFALYGENLAAHPFILRLMIVLLLAGTSSVLAMLTPYSSEVFPTRIRARGTGLANMFARTGGFLAVGAVLFGLATPSLAGAALLGAVPMALGAVAIGVFGVETRRLRLEEISPITR